MTDVEPSILTLQLPRLRWYQKQPLLSRKRNTLVISATQIGKSFSAACWITARAWMDGSHCRIHPWWWASPTYEQARIGARLVAAIAQSAGILFKDTTRPPLYVSLINGGYIEFRSWERAQNLFGPTIAGAVIDEFGELNDEAYGALSSRRSG